MSCYGIPSVIATIKSNSAYNESIIAYFANNAGTYITDASQFVYFLASKQFLKIGKSK